MAEGPERRGKRSAPVWIAGAVAVAVLLGLVYYFASVATQPSVVSGEGADLTTPEEVEAERLEDGQAPEEAE